MFTNEPCPDQCIHLWDECRSWAAKFLAGAPLKSENRRLTAESEVDFSQQSVYLIKEGLLRETLDSRIIINHEEGDLVGLDRLYLTQYTQISTSFAIIVDEYDGQVLVDYIQSDQQRLSAWNQYLISMFKAYQLLAASYNHEELEFRPEIREYEKDDVIIQEGATENEVFTLISGSAQVVVGDTPVGQVHRDEIFGAIAALTGTPRTATVIASSNCTVLVVQSDRFKHLLTTRPDTVEKLIEDMARSIVSSNEKIVALSMNK